MVSRRDFLRVGSLSVVGLPVAEQMALASTLAASGNRSCIFILMTGGASQFETFDPKPDAPAHIRGPLKAIATSVPGTILSEGFPRLAERAERFAILRSLYHDAAPIHETGLQLLQSGRLARNGQIHPSVGSVIARTFGQRDEAAPFVTLPGPLRNTGVNCQRGEGPGFWDNEFGPVFPTTKESNGHTPTFTKDAELRIADLVLPVEPESARRLYGNTRFGRLLLASRQLVEQGSRCVTVNLFDNLAGEVTWDCHADRPSAPATLYDYRDTLCPEFDRALSALLDDLEMRGLLDETLIVAVGEFGRTPYLNSHGGRDHWPGVWSALLAGGGVAGGQVIGASDARGSEPADRPIHAAELTASIYRSLGLDLDTVLVTDDGVEHALVGAAPIDELFA